MAVSGGHTFSSVSAGPGHACGVTATGAAYCWGLNRYGQLGDGSTSSSSVPVIVTGGFTFSTLTAGGARFPHTCGVTTGRAAYCWGNYQQTDGAITSPMQVSGELSFATLVAGGDHRCGVTLGSIAYCWGSNSLGELGDGTTNSSLVPVKVAGQP